jgi:DNA-binding MarR family transcriptional regulator
MLFKDDLIGFNTVRTARKIQRMLNLKLKPYKVTSEQWGVLKRLYEKDHVTQKDLSERSDKDQATLTKILDLLEKQALVKRGPNPDDRRAFLICITEKGSALVEELIPLVEDLFARITDSIDQGQLATYVAVLNDLQESLEKLSLE